MTCMLFKVSDLLLGFGRELALLTALAPKLSHRFSAYRTIPRSTLRLSFPLVRADSSS